MSRLLGGVVLARLFGAREAGSWSKFRSAWLGKQRIAAALFGAVSAASGVVEAATQYTYRALNRLTEVRHDSGQSNTCRYDAAGSLLETVKVGATVAACTTTNGGTWIDDLSTTCAS